MPSRPALILALDVGTSSCRALLYDARGRRVGAGLQVGYAPTTTADGGAELDPDVLLRHVVGVLDAASPYHPQVAAVAVTTFWHSLLGVGADGAPVTPLFVWMDARSRAQAAELARTLDERAVHARTGSVLHWSYWPARLRWLRESRPEAFRRATRWLSFGEYLYLHLFGAAVSSVSMASGTGLLDQHTCAWDAEMLAVSGVDASQLSPPVPLAIEAAPRGLVDRYAQRWPALDRAPWLPAVGDGATSNLGAGCATRERLALMVGTSAALRVTWRQDPGAPLRIPWGTWSYRVDRERPILGGAFNDGGSLLAWLRQTLRLPGRAALEDDLARLPPDGHGLTLLPFWAGERSTAWAFDARGAISGMRLHTSAPEIYRAALEGVALRLIQLSDRLAEVVPEARTVIATGAALIHSPAWLQIMADALGRSVQASVVPEASSRGVALLALEALGLLGRPLEDLAPPLGRAYEPRPEAHAVYRAAAARQAALYQRLVGE